MADVLFLAIVVAFFVLCGGLVSACARLIDHDDQVVAEPADDERVPVGAVAGARS